MVAAPASAGTHAKPPKLVWIGTLTLAYTRHYEFPRTDGRFVEELQDRIVKITNHADGTATASVNVRNDRTSWCTSKGTRTARLESWAWRGPVTRVSVAFHGTVYQLGFALRSVPVSVKVQDCDKVTDQSVKAFPMPVGFQLKGRAAKDARTISGEWGHYPDCKDPCVSLWSEARWSFVLVAAKGTGGGGGRGGGGVGVVTQGNPLVAPGADCDATLVTGTARDDHLVGTAAPELLRGLDGNDTIDAGDGSDCLRGGNGDDVLLGGSGNDLLNGDAGTDRVDAGAGDDEVYARDGAAETIDCGPGNDPRDRRRDRHRHRV